MAADGNARRDQEVIDRSSPISQNRAADAHPPHGANPAALPQASARQRLLELRRQQRRQGSTASQATAARLAEEGATATDAQQAMWFLDSLQGSSLHYHSTLAARLSGAIDLVALKRSLEALVDRHESLRMAFVARDGKPVPRLSATAAIELAVRDVSVASPEQATAELQRLLLDEVSRPFDLSLAPLLRVQLLRLAPDEHVLQWVVHHIVADGWSMGVIARDLSALYTAFSAGDTSPLPPLTFQYGDHALRQRDRLRGERLETHLKFWRTCLSGLEPLELPTDRPRPAQASHAGSLERFGVPAEVLDKLRVMARRHDATLFMALLAAFKVLLMRYSGQENLAVGSPVAGRDRPELEALVGYFVNTLVLRSDLSGNPTFNELLCRVRDNALEAYTHQELPFDRLVAELKPDRDLSRNPLYQVSFGLNNQPATRLNLAGLQTQPLALQNNTAKFDLSMSLTLTTEGLQGFIEYSTDLFDAATIERMVSHFKTLLEGIVADPDQRVALLPILSAGERSLMLTEWSQTAQSYPVHLPLHALFEQQVTRTPDAVAVVFEDTSLSYAALNRRANVVAHHLRELGVTPNQLVGLRTERNADIVVGILAILKSGGAYLPLDPIYPRDRIAFMLEDSGASILLTQTSLKADLAGLSATIVCVDEPITSARNAQTSGNPPSVNRADDLAYVIYTSGSTGKPKGVCITHHNVARLFAATDHLYGFDERDVWTLFHSYAFDFSVWELWGALLYGGRLVCVSLDISRNTDAFRELLLREGVTVLNQTPTAFRQLIDTDAAQPKAAFALRYVIFGGEALELQSLRAWFERYGDTSPQLINMYGITETTVHVTYRPITLADLAANAGSVIGEPIADLRIYVLDAQAQLVPPGVPGEMYVAGAGVSPGYLNRAELTTQRFLPDAFGTDPNARMYRSGDIARRLASGELEFLGRMDQQVKIRGFRIELGEIEAVLSQHPRVTDAVVVARGDTAGDKTLVAYVVGADTKNLIAELRSLLKDRLPNFMMPSAFVSMKALPLTPNGKINRKELPAPQQDLVNTGRVAPRSPAEQAVWDIWRDLLGVNTFGVHDNFFELDGHSLLAAQAMSRLRETLQIELPLRTLFDSPTVAGLAQAGQAQRSCAQPAPAPASIAALSFDARQGLLPLSAAQQRMWFWQEFAPGTALYNVSVAMALSGPLDAAILQDCLHALIQRHEILRTRWVTDAGQPWQRLDSLQDWPMQRVDLSLTETHTAQTRYEQWAESEAARPFDLTREPAVRASLVSLGAGDHRLHWTLHHSVCDGWSIDVLIDELCLLYEARCRNQEAGLPVLTLQYADHAAWEAQWLADGVRERELAYWTLHLAGAPGSVDLPTDHRRLAVQRFRGASIDFKFSQTQAQAMRALAHGTGTTLFMTVLSLWQTLLHRYSSQATVVTGSVIANRDRLDIEGVVGYFANTLALRSDFADGLTVAGLLAQVKTVALNAYDHRHLPFEEVVDALKQPRDSSRMPLIQTMVVLQPPTKTRSDLGPLSLRRLAPSSRVAKFDLTLSLREQDGALAGEIEYDTDLFERATVERLVGHLQTLVDAMCADPSQRIAQLPLLTADERELMLTEWNRTARPYPVHVPVHAMFEQQVQRTPDAVAVVFEDLQLSYGQLNAAANAWAHHLVTLGVGPDVLVGVCMERSPELVVALLAVLKAGGAFVPMDPELPAARLAYLLQDTNAPVVLTQSRLLDRLARACNTAARALLCLDSPVPLSADANDANPRCRTAPEHLAYVIYTSGSTGRPKGVMVPHRGLSNHVCWLQDTLQLLPHDRTLQWTTISFDASLVELFLPLQCGAGIVLAQAGEQGDTGYIARLMCSQDVTIVQMVPSALRGLLADPSFEPGSLRHVISGGEALDRQLALELQARLPQATIGNFYGPTENSIDATHCELPVPACNSLTVPIGKPIANVQCYVLDAGLQPVPVGVAGELCIGGMGLARGYLNQPESSAERFVPHPFRAGERLYRSGDRVRYAPDGNIEYLGRSDFQVKIRGFRIELGEIEVALHALAGVDRCVVVDRQDTPGSHRLVAYVVGAGLKPADLKLQLGKVLPEYMVPTAFALLPELPLLLSGKIDHAALPVPGADLKRTTGKVAPRSPAEQVVWDIWRDVLGIEAFGVHDNFFELGGHSLMATRINSRLRAVLQAELPLRALFEAPTVAELTRRLPGLGRASDAAFEQDGDEIPRAAWSAPRPVSFAQRGMWLRQMLEPQGIAYNLALAIRLRGQLDRAAWRQTVHALVERHETFRTTLALSGEEPVQVIEDRWHGDIEFIDLLGLPASTREDAALTLLRERTAQPYDLAAGPLHRPLLVRIGETDHTFVWLMHHAIVDDWSFGILQEELSTLYNASLRQESATLAPLPCSYGDYAVWQRQLLDDRALSGQLGFWREQLLALNPMALPTDRPVATDRASSGSSVSKELPPELLADLRGFSAAHAVTPFMTLLATFQLLLSRYCAQADVFVGAPIANRTNRACEPLVGALVNTLVLRSDLACHPTFGAFLQSVRSTALQAYAHQELPFDLLVEKLRSDRRSIDLRVLFNVLNTPKAVPRLDGLDVELFQVGNGSAQADLSLSIDLESTRRATLNFATDLYDAATAQRMLSNYVGLLGQVLAQPDRALEGYVIAAEADSLLQASYNRSDSPFPSQARITDSITAAALRTPDATALEFGPQRLSHGELQSAVNRLARELRSRGIGRGALVGLCVERSPGMVVAQLAILQSGAAYVPLDPGYPAQRLAYMAADAGLALLVSESAVSNALAWPRSSSLLLDLDAASIAAQADAPLAPDAALDAGAEDPAYVIYTSGSTGQPKGVVVPHRAVVNFLTSMAREPGMSAADRWLAVTTLSFDISVLELLLPLSVGAQLILASREQASDGHALRALLESSQATGMQATPATWRLLVESGWAGNNTFKALVGGESLPLELAEQLLARSGELWNMYGPTETTVWSSCWRVSAPEQGICIGRPIANTSVWILDPHLQLCPVGVPGEICIGGAGVAPGFLNRPELTAQRFVADPFSGAANARLYRTGDRGRWRSDGLLEHLGRFDDQVKLRGHRIELGEIEAALASHPGVAQAVAALREDKPGDVRLVAYAVPRQTMPADDELRAHLRRSLPEYMLPQHFVALERVPRLPNGKTDRSSLPAPAQALVPTGHRHLAEPRTETEIAFAAVWRDMLDVEAISVTDNFFDLGGHSLLAMRTIAEIERRTGHRLSPRSFIFDSLAQMATAVNAAPGSSQASGREGILGRLGAATGKLRRRIIGR